MVEIGDNGPGLSAEQVAQLVEAFITDGLERVGLAIGETLVREAGGEIEVDSRQGEGTRFRVWLPRAMPPARAAPGAASEVVIIDTDRPRRGPGEGVRAEGAAEEPEARDAT